MMEQEHVEGSACIIEARKRSVALEVTHNEFMVPKNILPALIYAEKKEVYKKILEVVKIFIEKILKSLGDIPSLIVVSDGDGYLLDMFGDKKIKLNMTQLGVKPGIQFNNEDMGTNIVNLTLEQKRPVKLTESDYLSPFLHNYTCYGVPFHDVEGDRVLGSISIITSTAFENPFLLMTLTTIVDAIERELSLRRENERLNSINQNMQNKIMKIQEEKKELQLIINNLQLPIIRISCPSLKVLEINQKAFDIIKIIKPDIKSAMQIRGNRISDIIATFLDEEYFDKVNEVIRDKEIKYLNKKNHIINGKEIYWNVILKPVSELEGEISEIVVLIIDITTEVESNKVMEKILKSQEELLANVSHELKTPLNVIYSTIQLFSMYCRNGSLDENKDSVLTYINSMIQNCYRLFKLINNIVDLSKIEAGFIELNLSNNNIVEIIEDVVMSVTAYTDIRGLNIIFDTDIEERTIACDPEKIERIILNLVSNAIKFSDEGNQIFVNVQDKNEFIEISVKDNGVGIEHNQLGMIFNRFKQVDKALSRNPEGTGIGLSLVKAFVEMHEGRISVQSKLGKGSKFIVMLPNKKVLQENIFIGSKIRNKTEDLQVELSDICCK